MKIMLLAACAAVVACHPAGTRSLPIHMKQAAVRQHYTQYN